MCFIVLVAISWNFFFRMSCLFTLPPNRRAVKSGGEEKVSMAGGCFLVLDRDLLLPIPLYNFVFMRTLEKGRAHLGGKNSRMKQTKNRLSEGEFKKPGLSDVRMEECLQPQPPSAVWSFLLCSYCPGFF